MKRWILDLLKCPNSKDGHLEFFALETRQNGSSCNTKDSNILNPNDEIISGLIINQKYEIVFPIHNGIGILLSDSDTDVNFHISLLEKLKPFCPETFHKSINSTINRLRLRPKTFEGEWNREEMAYYDHRDKVLDCPPSLDRDHIRRNPDWYRAIARRRELVDHVIPFISGKLLLEIGCGSAKNLSFLLNPSRFHYNYVGVDISWQRLLWASAILPEGNFFQASALNLPFISGIFDFIFAFGTLHHLPHQLIALRECERVLKSNGYFGFHEPIQTRKLIPSSRFGKKIGNIIGRYIHSEHDQVINYKEVKNELQSKGFEIINEFFYSTPIGYILYRILRMSKIISRSKLVSSFVLLFDVFWARTVGLLSERLGPRAVIHLSRRFPS